MRRATHEVDAVTATWRLYLQVGVAVSVTCVVLPLGVGRDILYCLVGFSAAGAILVGVRRNQPAHPAAWYLIATGTATWAVADGLFGWYQHVALIEPFPSFADVLYLAVYPLFAAGLLVLGRRRGGVRGPSGLDETAILTVGLGLLAWVFIVAPTWTAYEEPLLSRLTGVAYPFCDVLLFAILMRLTTSTRVKSAAFRLVAGSVGTMLIADGVYAAGTYVPFISAHAYLLDLGWLLSYVLWGTAALHPSMRELSSPPPARTLRFSAPHLVGLGLAIAIGPALLGWELLVGRPLDVAPIALAGCATMVLVVIRVGRIMRLLDLQAEQLSQLADTDYVTDLVNRRYFVEQLNALLGVPHPQVTGILLVQLERFSEINDTLGNASADAILHAVGVRLGELTGDRALVARMGNDLFGVLDPSVTSGDEADRAAVTIREAVERPLALTDLNVSVEVSIGALVLPADGAEPDVALLRAGVALSVARARSERTARYGIEMESPDRLSHVVIGELPRAIENGDIVVHYQPQVEIGSGRVLGVEALVRWQHPRYGLLGPDTFIPSAEQTGLIGPLTQYVLNCALRQCAHWQDQGLNLVVAVNLSVRNLLDPGLVDDVRSALERHGLEASSLEIEITESSAMVNPRRSIDVLGALADLGVQLSIDDYGTGHSSLAYLQRLPVGRLKLDRSFVTEMIANQASAAIVDSTIQLSQVLRLEVVAEGVEDDETLLKLRDMNCGTAQGFGIGPPVSAWLLPELIALIEERLSPVLGTPARSRGRTLR